MTYRDAKNDKIFECFTMDTWEVEFSTKPLHRCNGIYLFNSSLIQEIMVIYSETQAVCCNLCTLDPACGGFQTVGNQCYLVDR